MISVIDINPLIKGVPWKQCYEKVPQISTIGHLAWLVWLTIIHSWKGAPKNNVMNRFHKYVQLVISHD